MLINLWYVAEWSHAVKDKPVKAKLLGQNFVLFRDAAGKVHCEVETRPLEAGPQSIDELRAGTVVGRVVFVP